MSEIDYTSLASGDYDKFDSVCSETMVGFMRYKETNEWACAHAVQDESAANRQAVETPDGDNALAYIHRQRNSLRDLSLA